MRRTLFSLVDALNSRCQLPEPIVEFGARRAPGQEGRPSVGSSLPGRLYFGADMQAGTGVHQLQDLHDLGLAGGSVGTALLFDVMEHVRRPFRAMDELRRVVAPGGLVVMTSVFYFPIHAHPDDYWRFSASGFEALLDGWQVVGVAAAGPAKVPHTVVAIGSPASVDPALASAAAECVAIWASGGATSWKERAALVLPPPLLAAGYDLSQRMGRPR